MAPVLGWVEHKKLHVIWSLLRILFPMANWNFFNNSNNIIIGIFVANPSTPNIGDIKSKYSHWSLSVWDVYRVYLSNFLMYDMGSKPFLRYIILILMAGYILENCTSLHVSIVYGLFRIPKPHFSYFLDTSFRVQTFSGIYLVPRGHLIRLEPQSLCFNSGEYRNWFCLINCEFSGKYLCWLGYFFFLPNLELIGSTHKRKFVSSIKNLQYIFFFFFWCETLLLYLQLIHINPRFYQHLHWNWIF